MAPKQNVSGKGIASRTRGARKKKEEMPIPECHPNLLWHGESDDRRKRFNDTLLTIGGKEAHRPRIINWEVLKNLGCHEILEDKLLVRTLWNKQILTTKMWERALNINEPIYKECCLEFLCSFGMKTDITTIGVCSDKCLTFRLGGREHVITLWEFGNLLGLYSEEDLRNQDFKYIIMLSDRNKEGLDENGFWRKISTESELTYGESKVSSIRKPILQVFHRIVVESLLHRVHDVDKILEDDLWVLFTFEERHPLRSLDVAWLIAKHLHQRAAKGSNNYICGGHFITRIAKSLGLFNQKEMVLFRGPIVTGGTDAEGFAHLREVGSGKLKGLPEELDVMPLRTWIG